MQFALEPVETMSREEWLQKRRTGISGTDIAGIFGKSPWQTPIGVYLDKLGLSEASPETPVQKRGKRMESTVAGIYADETGLELIDPGFLRHREHEWIVGTPDRIALQSKQWMRGLEIKTAHWSQRHHWGEPGTDQVPMHYLLQVAWYMCVTNVDVFDLWAMFGLDDIRAYTIHRDLELESILIERADKFWRENILAGVMPAVDGSDKAAAYILSLFPKNIQPLQEAPEGALELARKAKEAQERKKQAEYEEDEYKNRLKALIGEAEGFSFGDSGKVTWKKEKDSVGPDWETIAKEINSSLSKTLLNYAPELEPVVSTLLDSTIKQHTVVKRVGARKLLLNLKETA